MGINLCRILTMPKAQQEVIIRMGPRYELISFEEDGTANMAHIEWGDTMHVTLDGKFAVYDMMGRPK